MIFRNLAILFLISIFTYCVFKIFPFISKSLIHKETIEIKDESIIIEKSGSLGFYRKITIKDDNIHGITTSFHFTHLSKFGFLIPFRSTIDGAFLIWFRHGWRKYYSFGKDVSLQDTQNMINTIYKKFPKYRITLNL
jgi:hypothetical protein